MKKLGVIVASVTLLAFPIVALASEVHCPEHGYASCYFTGSTKAAADGHLLKKYHCSCGDEWWIRED